MTSSFHNPDWPDAAARWGRFWSGEKTDRPVAVIFAWDDAAFQLPPYTTLEERFSDPSYLTTAARNCIQHTHWLGENHATLRLDLGPVCGARLWGARPDYGEGTIWHHPIAEAIDETLEVMQAVDVDAALDSFEQSWTFPRAELCAELNARAAVPDLGGPADIIATLMGSEAFCMDLAEDPDSVAEALILSARAFNRLAKRMLVRFGPAPSDWLNLYNPDGYFTIGEDMTALVSPQIITDLFAPALATALDGLPHPVFHWHNGAMVTLDAVLALPEIEVLQWTSDINHIQNPPSTHLETIAKVFDAGKKLFLYIEPEEIEAFAKRFPAENLAFGFNAKSREHGFQILAQLNQAYGG